MEASALCYYNVEYKPDCGTVTHMAFKDFLQGAGSVLNLWPAERDEIEIHLPEGSDASAIQKDWEAVGNDLKFSMEKCDSHTEI